MKNEPFKIIFPGGYNVENIESDNIDINVTLSKGKVYFGTAFTLDNIKAIVSRNKELYFWATNMFIVENLDKDILKYAIEGMINDEYLDQIFFEVGDINKVYGPNVTYESIISQV